MLSTTNLKGYYSSRLPASGSAWVQEQPSDKQLTSPASSLKLIFEGWQHLADVTVDYGGTVLGGHTASESNLSAASEGCHLMALALQVIMSDLQTSMPVGDDILQMIVCLRGDSDNLGGSSAIVGDHLRLLVP
jgi:hypothetical protein